MAQYTFSGVGSFTLSPPALIQTASIPYGAAMFSPDHLASASLAIAAGNAPYSAAFSAMVQQAIPFEGHASNRVTIANTNSPALPTNTFGCPAAGSSQAAIATTIQGLFNTDMTVAVLEALTGFMSNLDAPTAKNLVRDWTTGTLHIASYDIPSNFGGSDGPLMMNTEGAGVVIAAALFDEATHGNWSKLSGWTATDRTNTETYVSNVWVSSSLIVLGLSAPGNAPNNNMMNNWRSHACQTLALGGFYLLGSTNPTTVALGQTYVSQSAALIAGYLTGSITNTNDAQVGWPFIIQTSGTLSSSMKADPGDITTEDERGIDALAYTMFSARSFVSAMQIVRAAGGPNFFAQYSGTLNLMLSTLLAHAQSQPTTFMDCFNGVQNTLPYNGAEVFEAMGAYFSSSAYTSYASGKRPTGGQTTMIGAAGQGAVGVHSFATLTSLMNTSSSMYYLPPLVIPNSIGTGSAFISNVPFNPVTASIPPVFTSSLGHPNEPSGFTPVIDTGFITGAIANSQTGGTFTTFHNGITNTWNNFGPSGSAFQAGGTGFNPQYIMIASGSPPGSGITNSGFMQRFDTTLAGGNNPVNVQCLMQTSGSGCIYISLWMKLFAQNGGWSHQRADGTYLGLAAPKWFYLRSGGAGNFVGGQENHALVGAAPGIGNYQHINAYMDMLKQINAGSNAPTAGAFEDYPRFDVAPFNDISVMEPQANVGYMSQSYVQMEWIIQQETTANTTNDARVQFYVSGVIAYDSANNNLPGTAYGDQGTFNLLAANSVRGWWGFILNSVWGGAAANQGPLCPNGPQYLCMDDIYVSVSPQYLTGTSYTNASANWTGSTYLGAPQGGVFSFPNIPAGWTWTTNGISHKRNIAVGPGDGVNPQGGTDWGDGASSPYPNETVITDSTAPFKGTLGKFGLTGNSPTCMQITYPAGLTQGNTPINEWIIGAFSSNQFTKMYCAFAVKIQSGFFFNQSGVQKFFYFNTTLVGGSNAVIILRGSDNGNGTYHMVYTTQAPGPQSANFQGTKALNTGQWYIMEAFVQMNNPGSSANAIVQLWITDPSTGITVQDINANTAQLTSITGDYFSQWSWAPYWGGNTSNGPLSQTQYIYWNDFYTFAST